MSKKPATPKKHTLNIFETILPAIDRHDLEYYTELSPEDKKGFASPVAMRFASAVESNMRDWYLIAVNERSNLHHYDLYQHPDLQFRLLASCGMGRMERHVWIAAGGSKEKARANFILRYWPEANDLEISIILQHFQEGDNLDSFLQGSGLQVDEVKKIKKLFE